MASVGMKLTCSLYASSDERVGGSSELGDLDGQGYLLTDQTGSAFMIDISQVAMALRGATERSLLILDEFGKGKQSLMTPACYVS